RWYRASEVRERMMMIDAEEPDDDSTDLIESGDDGEEDGQTRPLPQLRNTDGEKFTFIEDHYELVGEGARAAIEADLAKMPDVEAPNPGAGERRHAVVRENGGDSAIGNTVIGSIWVRAHEVVVESNSRKRAKQMRKRMEAAFGNRVHFVRREEKTVGEVMAEGAGRAGKAQPAPEGPEIDAVLR